jgi:hypothetical protein
MQRHEGLAVSDPSHPGEEGKVGIFGLGKTLCGLMDRVNLRADLREFLKDAVRVGAELAQDLATDGVFLPQDGEQQVLRADQLFDVRTRERYTGIE